MLSFFLLSSNGTNTDSNKRTRRKSFCSKYRALLFANSPLFRPRKYPHTFCRCSGPFCRSVCQLQKCVTACPPSHTFPGCTSSTSSQIKDKNLEQFTFLSEDGSLAPSRLFTREFSPIICQYSN